MLLRDSMITKKIVYSIIYVVVIIGIIIGVGVYYFAFTNKGSDFIVRSILTNYLKAESVDINKSAGSFTEALVYQDIELHNLKQLPDGNSLKIQRLEISLNSFSLQGLDVKIQNGRLQLPGSEAILFYGDYLNGILDISAYTNSVSIRTTLDRFAEASALKNISGFLKNVDMNIRGSFLEPEIKGNFIIKNLSRDKFSMTDCLGKINLKFTDITNELKVNGDIFLEKGVISGPKTAVITLGKGKIIFTDNLQVPALDLRGTAVVEDVKISIVLKGTFSEPDLKLTSKPAMDQDRLLLMLATDKAWRSTKTALSEQELSADIIKDFLGYFVFSGSGGKIAQKYGIRDILLKHDDTTTKVGATKDVTSQTAVSYSVEQQQDKEKKPSVLHQVGAEYKITENISLSGEKEIKQNNETDKTEAKQKTDDKVILKFKKEF